MFRLAFDRPTVVAVGIFSGSENSDADFQAYVDSFASLDEVAKQQREARGVYVLVVDPENPQPDARWRKRIAYASADIGSNPLASVVTGSALIRGVVTAINWIRPPPFDIRCHENLEAAAAWVRSKRGDDILGILRRLEREARGTGTSVPPPRSVRSGFSL